MCSQYGDKPLKYQPRSRIGRWFYINRAASLLRSFSVSLSFTLFFLTSDSVGVMQRAFLSYNVTALDELQAHPFTYCRNWLRFLLLILRTHKNAAERKGPKNFNIFVKRKKKGRGSDKWMMNASSCFSSTLTYSCILNVIIGDIRIALWT